ncbi:putative tubulin like protein [Erwinia phage vB_EamM_RisingSun]|uniref:Putative tubulin like protein n=2 Tax=Risingsunvirus risingsun TaxID=2560435 RepID=A0A223LIG8_9CAUD|nr:tubulin PhuZ [Erwinia phage vB_EamM_RisingSun]ASU03653.1 putative tubulin like protein [Erwinia phage vB_EamM_RisingSun]ASU03898.1 putative tubulin like protein [Erwinia phage vB_EamM_Joad]
MSELQYYLCGGAGISIGVALKQQTNTAANRTAKMVGIDSSDRNDSDGLFPVVRMEGTRGSGKVKSTNAEPMKPFLAEVLTQHKPASFNIIVCNAAGGTGSLMATYLLQKLVAAGKVVFLCLASDETSQKEFENVISTKRSFAAQTEKNQLDVPVPYLDIVQTPDMTRGDANRRIVNQLDLLSLFATETNEEVDYQDILSMVRYSKTCNVAPALSKITFHDQETARSYTGKVPVAVCSLFDNRDAVAPLFEGCVYRATGVFNKSNNPPADLKEIHMVFDHGEAIDELKERMELLNDRKIVTANKYSEVDKVSDGADDSGVFY